MWTNVRFFLLFALLISTSTHWYGTFFFSASAGVHGCCWVPPQPSVPSSHTTCWCSKQSCLVIPTRSGVVGHGFFFPPCPTGAPIFLLFNRLKLTARLWVNRIPCRFSSNIFKSPQSPLDPLLEILSQLHYCHTMFYNLTFSAKYHRCLPLGMILFSRLSCIFYAFNCGLDTVVEVIALPMHSQSPRVEILVCLLLEVLIGCSSLGVYACDAISSINDRAKLMPDKLYAKKKASG